MEYIASYILTISYCSGNIILINRYFGPHSSQGHRKVFTATSTQEANQLADECRSHGGTIHSLTPLRKSLEDLFMTEFAQTKDEESEGV